MADSYSVKINRQEGSLEITGDKEWVSSQLKELKGVYSEYVAPQSNMAEKVVGVTPVESKKPRKTPKRQSGTVRAQKNPELETKLTKELKEKLAKYVGERQANFDRSLPSQAAIIARFLQEELNWPGVDQHDIYTVYALMGWRSPGNPNAQLNNALSRNHYFSSITEGKYILSHAGENYASYDSLNTPES